MTEAVNPPSPAVAARVGHTGMSDLAVSPFGLPLALRAKEVRVAWVGRTSTEEHQDPRQSLLRQLERSKVALPDSWVIVAHFYDVESGRMELDKRSRKSNYERFDIPIARDGGIGDLLAEAAGPGRRFDVVMCESMARLARRMYETLSVERRLEDVGVTVFASNEPIMLAGGRAQQILQRRINQSVAEYEVLNMLEQSWGGTCTHVREGYNIGKPLCRTPERGPGSTSAAGTARWPAGQGSVVEVCCGRCAEEPEVHRLPGLQPPRPAQSRWHRSRQPTGDVGVVRRASARAVDSEVDVRRTGRTPSGQARVAGWKRTQPAPEHQAGLPASRAGGLPL